MRQHLRRQVSARRVPSNNQIPRPHAARSKHVRQPVGRLPQLRRVLRVGTQRVVQHGNSNLLAVLQIRRREQVGARAPLEVAWLQRRDIAAAVEEQDEFRCPAAVAEPEEGRDAIREGFDVDGEARGEQGGLRVVITSGSSLGGLSLATGNPGSIDGQGGRLHVLHLARGEMAHGETDEGAFCPVAEGDSAGGGEGVAAEGVGDQLGRCWRAC